MKNSTALILAGGLALVGADGLVSMQQAPPANPSTQRDLESAVGGAAVALVVWGLARGKRGLGKAALVGAAAGFLGGRIGFPGVTK